MASRPPFREPGTTSSTTLPVAVDLPDDLQAEIDDARDTLAAAKSPATRKAYASDWKRFCAFCDARNVEALPAHPDMVALFVHVEAQAGISPITIGRRIAAINHHHSEVRLVTPSARDLAGVIATMLAGVRRNYGRPSKRKAPAQLDIMRAMLAMIEGMGIRAIRDRAILALGMAGALRRSEIPALLLEDIHFVKAGLEITIAKSKGDQEAKGQVVAIPEGRILRPVDLLKQWLHIRGQAPGPVFLRLTRSDALTSDAITDKTVYRLVKAAAAAAGLDPALYSAHSLRAGFLTEAAAQHANLFKMKDHSRHKSIETVAGYVRAADRFDDHAGDDFL